MNKQERKSDVSKRWTYIVRHDTSLNSLFWKGRNEVSDFFFGNGISFSFII